MHNTQAKFDITGILRANSIKKYRIRESSRGFDHRIFLVYSDTGNYCVRIPVKEKNKLAAQSWAFTEWKRVGVPVPKTIVLSNDYLVEEMIAGKCIDESDLTVEQLKGVMRELEKYAKKMHTVRTAGYGYLRTPGTGGKNSWRDFIEPDFRETLADNVGHGLISVQESENIGKLFDKFGNYLNIDSPKLIHADLKQDNIMVSGEKITGIIDASDAMSGDVYYDLAVIRYWFGRELFGEFLREYGAIDERRLHLYLLYYSNWMIAFHGSMNRDEAKYRKACEQIQNAMQYLERPGES